MNRFHAGAAVALILVLFRPDAVLADPWDRHINNPSRFHVLAGFGGAAVLDRETDLVWERAPDTTQQQWLQAQASCNLKNVGGRKGWRLPAVQELASLVDPTVSSPGPTLPAGHPFHNIQTLNDPSQPNSMSAYWTANTWSADPNVAWEVEFNTGVVANTNKAVLGWVWCVRTGAGVDLQ